jgi:uncharacterized integral membrane protein
MADLWLKIKVWTKITLFGLVLLYVLVFVAKNSGTVELWVWPNHKPQTSVLLLALYAFGSGVVLTVLVRTTLKTMSQIRELQHRSRHDRLAREVADMKSKAGMLREKSAPGASPAPTAFPDDEPPATD